MERKGSARRIGARAIAALAATILATACVPDVVEKPLPVLVGAPSASSTLAGCDRAGQRIVATADTHLDPACTYTAGVEVRAADVVLDCRGARIEDTSGSAGRGIWVVAPADVPLSNVTVRNCVLKGFLNNVRVSRDGFRSLAPGAEYDAAFSDIVIENSHLYSSRGSGVFIDAYVSGVTLRDLEIAGSGSVGIYLEAGSRDNVVERNVVHRNGYADVVPGGLPIDLGGLSLRYESTGREGIAIDGSRGNVVRDNVLTANSAGAIFLYKNCGEFVTERPTQWWPRRYGADDNVIERNVIHHEKHGVWIGSRMSENQLFMDCSDPAYVSSAFERVHLDYAARNVVRENAFHEVPYGVRVEDDGARVEGNWFTGADPAAVAVLVGTWRRTEILGEPVDGAVVTGNHSQLPDPTPWRWIHAHTGTTYADNRVHGDVLDAGAPAPLVPGTQPTVNPFLFVIRFWAAP